MDHRPVLLPEVVEFLEPASGKTIVDATFGAGGHSRELLHAGARVIGVDQDPGAQHYAREIGDPSLDLMVGNFRNLPTLLAGRGIAAVDGILCDLGVSSMQLDEGERGFAFRQEGPLDMRMGSEGESAEVVVNEYGHDELAALIYRYGEERHSRRIARAIVAARQEARIRTTEELARVVASAYPPGPRREHPARRTFQALRIHVNDELSALEDLLQAAPELLRPGARLVIISYHSLEDRLVKRAFRDDPRLTALTKRPITAGDEEQSSNPRSRSAKLRAAERVTA